MVRTYALTQSPTGSGSWVQRGVQAFQISARVTGVPDRTHGDTDSSRSAIRSAHWSASVPVPEALPLPVPREQCVSTGTASGSGSAQ